MGVAGRWVREVVEVEQLAAPPAVECVLVAEAHLEEGEDHISMIVKRIPEALEWLPTEF